MANAVFRPKNNTARKNVWQEFISDTQLLTEHHVTDEEIQLLRNFAPLGMLTGSGDILFILNRIRLAMRHE